MADFTINTKTRLKNVRGEINTDFVEILEPEEVIRERDFKRRLNREIETRLKDEIESRMREMQPGILKEKKESFDKGFEEGVAEGIEKGQIQIVPLKEDLWGTIKDLEEFKEKLLKESESTIVKLAFNFAKKIVKEEIKTNEEIIKSQVREALKYIIGESKLIIRVNAENLAQFERKEKFIDEEYLRNIEIIKDDTVNKGGCIIESNSGIIDATIESQLNELERSLTTGLEKDLGKDTEQDK